MKLIKEHLLVVGALSLPLLFIAAVTLIVYLPVWLINPQYDFVYISCDANRYYAEVSCEDFLASKYQVVDGRLTVKEIDYTRDQNRNGEPDFAQSYRERIFLYDTDRDTSREITLDEIVTFTVTPLRTAPDGVTLTSGYGADGADFIPLFSFRSHAYTWQLEHEGYRQTINLADNPRDYVSEIHFVGWVITEAQ